MTSLPSGKVFRLLRETIIVSFGDPLVTAVRAVRAHSDGGGTYAVH